jgi:DHA2 family methylenomycin A resistance protein-like MFS transporter
VFLINLPIGVVSALLARLSIAETPRHPRGVDRFGQATAIAAMALVTAAVIHGGESGWASALTIGTFLAGILVAVAFWQGEHRIPEPMLPPAFFANRARTVAVTSAALMGFLFYGTLFLMSLYFQEVRGWSPGSTGIGLLPLTVGTLAGPFLIYRRLSRRFGHPVLLVAGFACCALGVGVLAPTDARTAYVLIALGLLLLGLASTVSFSALTSLLLGSVSAEHSGLASGVQNTTRQAGALMSVSILGAVLNADSIAARLPAAFAVLGVVVVLAIAISSLALGGRAGTRASSAQAPMTPGAPEPR